MKTIGERIKYLRMKHKVTQAILATGAGIVRGNITHYEKGDWNPNYETATKIATYFNVDPDWLYYGDENKFNEKIPYTDVKEELSEYEKEKDLSDMRYINGQKLTSKDKKYLENFIEGAIGEVMFNLKDDKEPFDLNNDDKALLAIAFKHSFQLMRETKTLQKQERKIQKELKSKEDKPKE